MTGRANLVVARGPARRPTPGILATGAVAGHPTRAHATTLVVAAGCARGDRLLRRRPQRYSTTYEEHDIPTQDPSPYGEPPAVDEQIERRQALTTHISNDMVRLYKDLFGRGPSQARTDFAGPDTVVVTLENSLTPAEQTMVDLGEHQRLRDIRLLFQHARADDFRQVIERHTGRRVRAFISGMDTREDVSCEVFYLER